MSAVTFDNLVRDLRADYSGQPRDTQGQFAANRGGFRSSLGVGESGGGISSNNPSAEGQATPSRGKRAALKVAGAAASIAIGIGAGLGASALSEHLRKKESANGTPAQPPAGNAPAPPSPPTPAPVPPPASDGDRFNQVVEMLQKRGTVPPPDAEGSSSLPPRNKALDDTLKEYREAQAKKYRKPTPKADLLDLLILDWTESKHPRDKTGKFAKKGAGSGGMFLGSSIPSGGDAPLGGGGSGGKAKESDGLDDLTIRDLKELARKNQVTGYSVMTKAELAQGIRASKANPNQQKRIRETLAKKAAARKVVGNTPAAKFLREFEKMTKIIEASGVNPALAGLAMGAWMVDKTKRTWEKERKEYQQHIADSAVDAANRARTIPVEDFSDKPNVVFAVGGYKGLGSTGEKIIDEFTKEDNPDSEWFRENANFVAIENNEYDVKTTMPKRLPGGRHNPAYIAESLLKSGGNMLKQRRRKRNEQAVDLAANLYAHAIARGGESGQKRVNEYLPITIVAHGAGGATVDEALAILRSGKMKLPDAAGGTDFLNQIQVIKLGSSNIGLADAPTSDKKPLSSRTFTSSKDPYSVLPKTNETWKSEVPGGDIEDYMRTESIRDEMLYAMGHDSSTYRSKKTSADFKKREKEKKERFQGVEEKRKQKAAATAKPAAKPAAPSPPPPATPPKNGPTQSAAKTTPTATTRVAPSKTPTKAQAKAQAKASYPKKAGFYWVPKEGHPEGGFFRKNPSTKKSDSAFDLVIRHILGV